MNLKGDRFKLKQSPFRYAFSVLGDQSFTTRMPGILAE